MGKLHVLAESGDLQVEWDAEAAATGDPEAQAAIAEAERILAEAQAQGATAFAVREGKPAKVLETFDPTEEKIVVVPRIVGG